LKNHKYIHQGAKGFIGFCKSFWERHEGFLYKISHWYDQVDFTQKYLQLHPNLDPNGGSKCVS